MNKLLKDAIADAKAVRETALANAKFALQEAFAPKIQSMLSHKIKEEMEEEEEVEVEEPSNDEEAALESRMRNNTGLYEDDDIFGDETGEGAADVAGNDPEAVAEGDEDEDNICPDCEKKWEYDEEEDAYVTGARIPTYNTQTNPPYYCDGGCGKKVGEGWDHDCERVCSDCKEEEEEEEEEATIMIQKIWRGFVARFPLD